VSHRIGYLEQMLEELCDRHDTDFMIGSQIADWFVAAVRIFPNGFAYPS
jgi:hypothetical protein|tara:strand:+ start:565 stop:711 length:147 start_codon:yes stop_codon:yes gene_type:complete